MAARKPKSRSRTTAVRRRKPPVRKAVARRAATRATRPARKKKTTARKARPAPRKAARKASRPAAARARKTRTTRSKPTTARRKAVARQAPKSAARKTTARKTAAKKTTASKPATRAARPAPPSRPVKRTQSSAARPPIRRAPEPAARPAPGLDRERRRLSAVDVAASSAAADTERLLSSARTGAEELKQLLGHHTETSPVLTAGDIDAKWSDAYAVGDEAPGGDNPTPDQDRVDDIGRALGVSYEDNEELRGSDKIIERDKHRWELDPASSDDWPHNAD